MGTLCWMAPEILDLNPKYSVYSDMYPYWWEILRNAIHKLFSMLRYSFAMVLWEIGTRERPYLGAEPGVIEGYEYTNTH